MNHETREKKLYAVLGATGAQGGPVVRRLLAAGHRVRAIGRTPGRVRALTGERLEPIALDLADEAATAAALEGVDGAFLQLPFVPVREVIAAQSASLGRALGRARVPLAVFTTSGPVPAQPTGVASFDTKLLAEETLRAAGAPLIVLRPGGYLENLSAPFSAAHVVRSGELRYPLPATHRQPWIALDDQAALVEAALARPDLAGRVLAVGTRLTGPELAAGIGEGLGRAVRYEPIAPATFGATLAKVMGEVVGEAIREDYELLGAAGPSLRLGQDTAEAWAVLGVAPRSVADWARAQDWDGAAAQWPAPDGPATALPAPPR